jgi:hypothetical protein
MKSELFQKSPLQNRAERNAKRREKASQIRPARSQMFSAAVYVISDGRLSKVGMSTAPQQRLVNLRTANGGGLFLEFLCWVENAREVEKAVHAILRPRRQHGEWFACLPHIAIEAVESVVADRAHEATVGACRPSLSARPRSLALAKHPTHEQSPSRGGARPPSLRRLGQVKPCYAAPDRALWCWIYYPWDYVRVHTLDEN